MPTVPLCISTASSGSNKRPPSCKCGIFWIIIFRISSLSLSLSVSRASSY